MRIKTKKIGTFYESKAINYLINHNYTIIGRNIYIGKKEIDILCKDRANEQNVLVEVKYKNIFFKDWPLFLNIDKKKVYFTEIIESNILEDKFNLTGLWRIDFIIFTKDKFYHYQNI